MQIPEKILLVDDEPRLLEGLKRSLRFDFNIEVAVGASAGLDAIRNSGPFAAVVSDLRMPGMDGVEFLAHVRDLSPDSIRIMLSGQADVSGAIAAVNEGHIFRFLTKPCPAQELAKTLAAALEQYWLVTAERELLQKTLLGTITVLTEVLAVIYPAAFQRSLRIKHYMGLMGRATGLQNMWQFEAAAVLSQIGCITLPLGTANKAHVGAELSEEEARLFANHPLAAQRLLVKIPRLEPIADMIAGQLRPYRDYQVAQAGTYVVTMGSQMLHIALELDRLAAGGTAIREALVAMQSEPAEYNPDLLRAIEGEPTALWRCTSVSIDEIEICMIAAEDIRAVNGLLLVSKGDQFTLPVLERLRCFAAELNVPEQVQVLVEETGGEAELECASL